MAQRALGNPSGDFFNLTDEIIEKGLEASRTSSRQRIIFPVQRTQESQVQRLLNFMQPGTYIRPHQHPMPHATESIVMLKGAIRFFTFDDEGNRLSDDRLSSGRLPAVIDIEPNVWHSFLVMEKDTIIFECKKGPYNADTDKKFADWSPEEGDPESEIWMKQMHKKNSGL
jgi:cupin fold WbuC family metalloprotein